MIKSVLKSSVAATALLLAACGQSEQTNSEAATEAEAPAAMVKAQLGAWGVDLSARNESVKPGDNFFDYASGTWVDNFEIPADRNNYGAFTVLAELSRDRNKVIIDDLKSGTFEEGTVEQKISD